MQNALLVLLARVLFPVSLLVFALFFYHGVEGMNRTARVLPIVLIAAICLLGPYLMAGEIRAYLAALRTAPASAAAELDRDGLRELGWGRATMIALASLIYVLLIDHAGLPLTAFLVYLICAFALVPRGAPRRDWAGALVGAVAAAIIFDVVFRAWLGLHIAGPLPGQGA